MNKEDETSDRDAREPGRAKPRPRKGWGEAFVEIEELSDEDRAWLDFGNADDDQVFWRSRTANYESRAESFPCRWPAPAGNPPARHHSPTGKHPHIFVRRR